MGEIIRGPKIASIPTEPNDPAWNDAPAIDIRLVGQIVQEPRLFNPSVGSLSVRALFDAEELALLFIWRDRLENKGQDDLPVDRVAVLFPAQKMAAGKKPYFLMGDRRNPVDAWQWSAKSGAEAFLARGMDDVTPRTSALQGQGVYRDGQYRVVLRRRLRTDGEERVAFSPGEMIPIAWNVWDGQNAEDGKQRAVSRWYYLLLEPETPWTTWLWPAFVVLLAGGGEAIGLRRLRQHWASQEPEAPALQEVSTS